MSIFKLVQEIIDKGEGGVLCTVVKTTGSVPRHAGSKMIVFPDGRTTGSVGGGEVENRVLEEAANVLSSGRPLLLSYSLVDPEKGDPGVCGGEVEVYLEPLLPKPSMVIVGAGHVGKSLAHIAHWLGFVVSVTDDRAELCTPERFPEADHLHVCESESIASEIQIHANTFIVLTTRGTDVDVMALPGLVKSPARFIGVIGSKRRWMATRRKLMENGMTEDDLRKINSPIGLEIQAETPEEIAVSIMAEIIRFQHGGSGEIMGINGGSK